MKKFTINCDFGGQMSPFAIYIGKPQEGHHPLHFQADWLSKNRGGTISAEVMDAVTQLQELADKNNVSLEELCVYALGSEEQQTELEQQTSSDESEEPLANTAANQKSDAQALPDEAEEKHESINHQLHNESEEGEDMASEGGYIEEEK